MNKLTFIFVSDTNCEDSFRINSILHLQGLSDKLEISYRKVSNSSSDSAERQQFSSEDTESTSLSEDDIKNLTVRNIITKFDQKNWFI